MQETKVRGLRLKDKVAIVTGGAYGIGRAFCLGMADEGAKIVISDINLKAAKATVEEIEAKGGEAMALETDVSIPEDTLEMAKKTVERFGKIDILINNAAVVFREKLTWGPFLCIRAVFPYIRKQSGGKIINIASGTFFSGPAPIPHYVASKGGVIGLTRSLSTALGQYNIHVNCIAPVAPSIIPSV